MAQHPTPTRAVAAAHNPDAPFDIDMVFTWVDGNDEQWQRQYADAKAKQGIAMHTKERDPVKFATHARDDIYYAVHTAAVFMPWLARIWLVTQRPQVPWWLSDRDDTPLDGCDVSGVVHGVPVCVIHHDSFFGAEIPRPTFNSMVIESQLHRIPQLAEHFIMSNDDMYTLKPLQPADWFTATGTPRVSTTEYKPPPAHNKLLNSWDTHLANMTTHCHTLGVKPLLPYHVATPVLKSALASAVTQLADGVQAMAAQPLRNPASFPIWYIAVALAPRAQLPAHVTQEYISGPMLQSKVQSSGMGNVPALVCIDQFDNSAQQVLQALLDAAMFAGDVLAPAPALAPPAPTTAPAPSPTPWV